MITKYNDFLLENLINESLIYFTPPVTAILDKLSKEDNQIAKELMNVVGTDVKPDITFVNFSDREGYFDFSTMKNAQKLIGDVYTSYLQGGDNDLAIKSNNDTIQMLWNMKNHGTESTGIFTKSRSPIKIGRMINSIFPGKFLAKDIEDFVNKFKAKVDNMTEKFIIVSGKDIATWYHKRNYKEVSGKLGSSCMADEDEETFRVYVENPEVCRMLILVEDNKLTGRAIIWKTKKLYGSGSDLDGTYFMDRQYTIKDSDIDKFRDYAKKEGWSYKTNNNHSSLETVTYDGQNFSAELEVQLKAVTSHSDKMYDYGNYPYMDTFRKYNPRTGILVNNDDRDEEESIGSYILDSTTGGYTEIESTTYSEYYDCEISRDDAVFSRYLDDWIYVENSVLVSRGSARFIGHYPDDYDDLCYDEWTDEHYMSDDCVYSDEYGSHSSGYIFAEDALKTATELNDEGQPDRGSYSDPYDYFHKKDEEVIHLDRFKNKEWYIRLSEEYNDWDDIEAIKEGLIQIDYKNQYILDLFTTETYLLKTDYEKNRFYLTKDDAENLGFELEDESNDYYKRQTDWFDYYKEVKTYSDPTLFRDKPLVTIKDILYGLYKNETYDSLERIKFIEKWYSINEKSLD